jgi:hypothetical protein
MSTSTELPTTPSAAIRKAEILPRDVVVDLYDLLRMSRMNVMYYGDRLWWLQAWGTFLDLAAATAASSGVIAAWQSAGFTTVPKVMGLIVAIVTVVRPILNLQSRIQRVSGLWSGYMSIFHTCEQITRAVRKDHHMTLAHHALLVDLHDRFGSLEQDDDTSPSGRKLDKYQARVMEEIPVTGWWVPSSDIAEAGKASAA